MSALEAEIVKATLQSGNADTATIATLTRLLNLDATKTPTRTNKANDVRVKATVTAARSAKATATKGPKHKAPKPVAVHEDVADVLPPKQRYALATSVVNITLKLLTEAPKDRGASQACTHVRPTASPSPRTPGRSNRTPSRRERALQPRSGNTTPSTASPAKSPRGQLKSPKGSSHSAPAATQQVTIVAECARLGFAHLRAACSEDIGVRDLPLFQIENGMLSLIGKMTGHGLDALAIRELRALKRRLQSADVPTVRKTTGKPGTEKGQTETLATLLGLEIDRECSHEMLAVVIAYHLSVLKLISKSRKPRVIEAAAKYVDTDSESSVASFIMRHLKATNAHPKAAKQLEGLSAIMLALCPSTSAASDDPACDYTMSPDVRTVFRLQCSALRLRREAAAMARQSLDTETAIVEPFSRCLLALMRRSTTSKADICALFDLVKHCRSTVMDADSVASGQPAFIVARSLASLADRAGSTKEAPLWTQTMRESCAHLPENHALRLAADIRALAILDEPSTGAKELAEVVVTRLDGTFADYETLLEELAWFLTKSKARPNCVLDSTLTIAAARFAQRFARAYPLKSTNIACDIVRAALSESAPLESDWVSKHSLDLFVQSGTLNDVSKLGKTLSPRQVWRSTRDALCFEKALGLLVRKCLRTSTKLDLCGWQLSQESKGLLLECQFAHIAALAHKTKYHGTAKSMLDLVLGALTTTYTPETFPIRRMRMATAVCRLHADHPFLLPAGVIETWKDCPVLEQGGDLFQDDGLRLYLADVQASLVLTKIFLDRRPSAEQLECYLCAWRTNVTNSEGREGLLSRVNDLEISTALVQACASLAKVMEFRATNLMFSQLLVDIHSTLGSGCRSLDRCSALLDLANDQLKVGYAEKANVIVEEVRSGLDKSEGLVLLSIQLEVTSADVLISLDRPEEAHRSLERTIALRASLPADKVPKVDRRSYELIHARGWLVYSRYLLATGCKYEAVAAGKRSMKLFNSIWKHLEKSDSPTGGEAAPDRPEPELEAEDRNVDGLVKGIKKLQLTGTSKNETKPEELKGAAYWLIFPDLCHSFLHLSRLYSHHGHFMEANFYCESALKLAQSVGSEGFCSRIRSHRAGLLTLAGRLEEAELCLTMDDSNSENTSLAVVERLRAMAALRLQEGQSVDAVNSLKKAAYHVQKMIRESCSKDTEVPTAGGNLKPKTNTVKSAASRTTRKPAATTSRRYAAAHTQTSQTPATCYVLEKLQASVETERKMVNLQSDDESVVDIDLQRDNRRPMDWGQLRLQYNTVFGQASEQLQSDFCYSMLPESTVSLPALRATGRRASTVAVSKAAPKAGRRKKEAMQSFADLLWKARACLVDDSINVVPTTTYESHARFVMVANVGMLLSAVPTPTHVSALNPIDHAFAVDYARISAHDGERELVRMDQQSTQVEGFGWFDATLHPKPSLPSLQDFSVEYIDALPEFWTALSLCLNETCTELYVARYCAGQSPMVVRLPFARHKPESDDEESFDFHTGKTELEEIIELSNYSCHSTTSETKKKTWWAEREALDRRLHELLVNIENVWFGGFKGLFSPKPIHEDLLASFRRSFEGVLDRHLPSRQAAKIQGKKLSLDDKVLELFIGLGSDQDDGVDLEESLADLLYFVVDILQFNGERNAYDEIDLDAMTLETLDALRSYHEAADTSNADDRHLILVLDRRLHAFPWESMPCLEGASVSRVGSMQSLRDRIVAMRAQDDGNGSQVGRHNVTRASGTYILNPSSDLPGTEATLSPVLSQLQTSSPTSWHSFTNEAPSEQNFAKALERSPITLYFGHGAGSQYIRPRTVKKLSTCSDVVWLMGCSSGAVTEYGQLEPQAVPLAYLLAGEEGTNNTNSKCMAVAATLWDVTDKDIDRFSIAVGEEWGLWPASAASQKPVPAKTPKKKARSRSPTTPGLPPKTPSRTPKASKTPKAARTPSRSGSKQRSDGVKKMKSLSQAVADSREACYLRYLNGAATVVYGVPVYLGD